jgi:putative ABC transport system permease protein
VSRFWGLMTAIRALRSRAASPALIFAVAAVAVAAGATGPTYYLAGQTSVLRDTVGSQPVLGRGYEVTESGPLSMSFAPIESDVSGDLGTATSLFAAPVQARQASAFYAPSNESLLLASSNDVCAHMEIHGSCPDGPGQIVVSQQLATTNGWRPGQSIQLKPWGPLTITGTYTPPPADADYWFDQLATYFPYEYNADPEPSPHQASQYDAVFAADSTLLDAPPAAQGTIVVSDALDVGRLRPDDVSPLSDRLNALLVDQSLQGQQAIVTGSIPTTMGQVRAAWTSLAVPVVVVTLELVAVAALLLWILVTDATAARGPEIALAKLRGYGRLRLSVFALSELGLVMVAAVPIGVLLGWADTAAIGAGLLRPGTPIELPALGWAAGAVAALGGLLAVLAGVRPTLRRSVMEQWRRSNQRPARPGWTFDAVVITGAVAGLAEVAVSGSISSAHQHPITLVVPGLVGLAVAVVAARLLPAVCGLAAGRLRRGGPAMFLALRQLSRRPGAMRTTTALATAFALASFAVSAWSLARANYSTVADSQVGAPTVLHVTIPAGSDLATLVAQADPTGRNATAVEEYFSNDTTTVAVNPAQWGHIALRGTAGPRLSQLATVDPAEPAPLTLKGESLRLDIKTAGLMPAGTSLIADVLSPGATEPTPVQFPALPSDGTAQLTANLPPCPCLLEDLTVEPPPVAFAQSHLQGSVTITGIDTDHSGQWTSLPVSAVGADRWYSGSDNAEQVTSANGGFTWSFQVPAGSATIEYRDRPFPLPAIAASTVTAHTGPFNATGLDGRTLPVDVIATAQTTPGAAGTGIVVDLGYAQLAAEGNLTLTQTQVWLSGDQDHIEANLSRQGVAIDEVSTAEGTAASLRRSGPGLAGILFLAEAAAAAALAAGTAIAALYLLARRRRYELAALLTVGLHRRRLIASVLTEQVLLVGFGALVGVAAGLGSAAALLRDVPEFATAPAGVALASFPPVIPLAPILAGAFLVVLGAAATAAVRLVAGLELTQLREAPT